MTTGAAPRQSAPAGSRHGLRQDDVEFAFLRIAQHLYETFAFLLLVAGNAFVHVGANDSKTFPGCEGNDLRALPLDTVFLAVGGHAVVGSGAKWFGHDESFLRRGRPPRIRFSVWTAADRPKEDSGQSVVLRRHTGGVSSSPRWGSQTLKPTFRRLASVVVNRVDGRREARFLALAPRLPT
jgi:hypothetical protein